MNQKTAYEQIITGKLQALPVPDMADAIWARIEAQLDLDMPTDDAPPTDPPRTPSGGGAILGGISFVFVIALITFLLFKKEPNKTPTGPTPANNTTIKQKGRETFSSPNIKTGSKNEPATLPTTTPVLPPALPDSNSVSILPAPVMTRNDSTVATLPIAFTPPATLPQMQDSIVPVKKGRGVPGLKDEDYRVVPKKDSTNNN